MPYCAYCGTEVQVANDLPCLNCQNPKSGRPRPVAAVAGSSSVPIALVVVILIPIVLTIIGILAAIAVPNLLTAMQRSKQKRTVADMRSISMAIETYGADHEREFPHGEYVASLRDELVPKYIRSLPVVDGWGHGFHYQCWSTQAPDDRLAKCDAYAIGSGGKDGNFESSDLRAYEGSEATTRFDSDIVLANGLFVRYPEGMQH